MGETMEVLVQEQRKGRGKNKKGRQAEKILLILLDGHEATVNEIHTLLANEIVLSRFASYLWDLKKMGCYIRSNRVGRKIVSYQLQNPDEMKEYMLTRKLIAPPVVELSAADFAVSA